jgi:type II secretory pathway component PulK
MQQNKNNPLTVSQRAQVFVVSLWLFLILTVTAVMAGHRVALGLRIGKFYRDKLIASCFAQSSVEAALRELANDPSKDMDSLQDNWADNEKTFKQVLIEAEPRGFGSIQYQAIVNAHEETRYGVVDEERKIDLNTAPRELLVALFEKMELSRPAEKVEGLLIWRGDSLDAENLYQALGYQPKKGKLNSLAELVLVYGFEEKDYLKLKEWATVYSRGLINVNTVAGDRLLVLAEAIAKQQQLDETAAGRLTEKILALRQEKGYFASKEEITPAVMDSAETNLLQALLGFLDVRSENFLIEAQGSCGRYKKGITAVYNRQGEKFLYWHET